MNYSGNLRWTRNGLLQFKAKGYESFEKLVLVPSLRERLLRRVEVFLQGGEVFQSLQLPWRSGIFLFGPSGSGKTAAGRAIAFALKWEHFTIPAHEILDSHLLERALAEAVSALHRVIVLEDVDLMIRNMEPEVFFKLLDHAMERAEGTFWIANSRHPEQAPKTQLLRPGRFDESIRLELPSAELRRDLIQAVVPIEGLQWDESTLDEWVEQTQRFTFSHFEELRHLAARLNLEEQDPSDYWPVLKSYVEDQLIAGDRWGGSSDATQELQERVNQLDPRVLMAALDMSDVFRRLMEKVLGDAAEQAKTAASGIGETP